METKLALSTQSEQELSKLLAILSYGKSKLSKNYTFWCIKGPTLEANAGITAMILEEAGHVAILNSIKKNLKPNELDNDYSISYLEQHPKTWTELIINVFVYDRFFFEVLKSAESSEFDKLSSNIKKVIEEEKFHCQFGKEWAQLLSKSNNFKEEFFKELERAFVSLEQLAVQISSEALVEERVLATSVSEIVSSLKQQLQTEWCQ